MFVSHVLERQRQEYPCSERLRVPVAKGRYVGIDTDDIDKYRWSIYVYIEII